MITPSEFYFSKTNGDITSNPHYLLMDSKENGIWGAKEYIWGLQTNLAICIS